MTKQELEKIFFAECTEAGKDGAPVLKGTAGDLVNWIAARFCEQGNNQSDALFSKAFTGMYDKKGKPIHEGDQVKLYYKGEYFMCRVIYDLRHAAFFIKWQDGYINQYFMNGPAYEVVNSER